MGQTKWFNTMQPQTLQSAALLLYLNAAFGLLNLLAGNPLSIVAIAGAAAAYGLANEKKLGWIGGIVVAGLSLLATLALLDRLGFSGIISLMFDILLLVLLLHPVTRSYQQTWFK